MTLITKPDYTYVWASGGAVVAPNDTKKQLGWVAEAPPFQYDNWLQNRQDQMLAHINQRGIAAWDGLTNYEAGGLSYVQGSDGKVYKSVAASGPSATVQNPTTDGTDTYWTIAFADVGAFLTQAAGDVRYTQRSNNLSDLTNVATARTNLGAAPVVSPSFTGTPTAPTAPVGTNTTQLATTAFVTTADNLKANINSPTFTGVPSAPTASAGTNTTQLANTAFVTAAVNAAPMLGVGQTWQNMTASRAKDTIYTNSTGRPIQLYITGDLNAATLTIGGVTLNSQDYNGGTFINTIIPDNTTYSLTWGGSAPTLWAELR